MSIHEYHTDIWLPKMEEKVRTAEYSQANKDAILEFEGYLFSEGIKSLRGCLKINFSLFLRFYLDQSFNHYMDHSGIN
jgi:hypothetical protein